MKRLCALILVAMFVVFTVFACAENESFTLRNGICFGNSVSEVCEKEQLPTTLFNSSSYYNAESYWGGPGTIANVEDSVVEFFFNEDHELVEMMYNLHSGWKKEKWIDGYADKSDADEVYQMVYDGLVRKYGKPGSGTDVMGIYHGLAIHSYVSSKSRTQIKSAEWLVPDGENHVKIELHMLRNDNSYQRTHNYEIYVDYAFVTNDSAEDIYQQLDADL